MIRDARFEAFMKKVKQSKNCWEWMGKPNINGYGRFVFNGLEQRAHRASYEFFVGKIPHGLVIDHLCRNPICVNPKHLEAVTQRENVIRGNGVGGVNYRKTHCPRGHEFTEDNLCKSVANKGYRLCLICTRNWERDYRKNVRSKNA